MLIVVTGLILALPSAVATPIGWAVGGTSTILRTDDGLTCTEQTTGLPAGLPQTNFRAVQFSDPMHGWIAGFFGRILHTDDGGETWTLQATGTTAQLEAMAFVDAQNGWAVGGSGTGTILHTTNGGAAWTSQALPGTVSENMRGVDFIDVNQGWAVGAGGSVLHTIDGGATWTEVRACRGSSTPWTSSMPRTGSP